MDAVLDAFLTAVDVGALSTDASTTTVSPNSIYGKVQVALPGCGPTRFDGEQLSRSDSRRTKSSSVLVGAGGVGDCRGELIGGIVFPSSLLG